MNSNLTGSRDPHSILKDTFGYDSFRPGQAELINAVCAGRDVMGIMPTGAGKSVCFQIPSLIFDGLTLVISPLISLMLDQVLSLKEYGIRAAFLNSTLTPGQQRTVLSRAANNAYQIMYVAPERLSSPAFLTFCQNYAIPFVAVDEAHCISQWGHAFRMDYLQIKPFIDALPQRPVVGAYTATATAKVREDIQNSLGLREPLVRINSFDRPNLSFYVQTGQKDRELRRFLRRHPNDSGIIYCGTRRDVESLCSDLSLEGLSVTRYHAGLSDQERTENQNDFLYDRKQIMVATNAFGMGIDKSNVAYVVHYSMPRNIESYYQEAGRAGRDGSPADCVLLYAPSDVKLNEYLIKTSLKDNPELSDDERALREEHDMELLKQMVFYSTTSDCLRMRILRYFGEESAPCGHCGNCLRSYESIDITDAARIILNVIRDLQNRGRGFGRTTLRDFFKGSESQTSKNRGLDRLDGYGALSYLTAERILKILDWLTQSQWLRKTDGDYPVLLIGTVPPEYWNQPDFKVVARLPIEEKFEPIRKASASADTLYETLRRIRRQLADEQHVPAYVIFSDATLRDIADLRPTTFEQFRAIKGVGQSKAVKYSAPFIIAIRDFQ